MTAPLRDFAELQHTKLFWIGGRRIASVVVGLPCKNLSMRIYPKDCTIRDQHLMAALWRVCRVCNIVMST